MEILKRDLCVEDLGVPPTYLLAEVEADFRGRGLPPRPRAARLPLAQLSCEALLSPSDEELTTLCSDIIDTKWISWEFTWEIGRSGRDPIMVVNGH